jgi:DNA-binding response OmpR family regulator
VNNSETKILIAVEEYIVALDIKNVLSKAGFIFSFVCSSGEDAVLKAQVEKPGLLILDCNLKGEIDGLTACEIIYAALKTPIIFLLGMPGQLSDEFLLNYTCECIVKPFEDNYLIEVVNKILNNSNK